VALKILAKNAGHHEAKVMKRIRNISFKGPGAEYLIRLLDQFEQPGNGGTHLCLILELMWQDARSFNPDERILLVQQISKQVCRDLKSYEHLVFCTMVSVLVVLNLTIDLHPNNFLLSLGSTHMTVKELLSKSGPVEDPERYFYERKVGSEWKRIYNSQPLSTPDGDLFFVNTIVVKIADFGLGSSI
jgi:serine/threonine protein kinase